MLTVKTVFKMAGQQNYEYLTQENYFDKAEEGLLQAADQYHLIKKFGIGREVDKDKLRHDQLFYSILCTDECELVDWVTRKINGDLDGRANKLRMRDFKVYDIPYGQNEINQISECCDWNSIEW